MRAEEEIRKTLDIYQKNIYKFSEALKNINDAYEKNKIDMPTYMKESREAESAIDYLEEKSRLLRWVLEV